MDYMDTLHSIARGYYDIHGYNIKSWFSLSKREVFLLTGLYISENPSCIVDFIRDEYVDEMVSDYMIEYSSIPCGNGKNIKPLFCESFTESLADYVCENYINHDLQGASIRNDELFFSREQHI